MFKNLHSYLLLLILGIVFSASLKAQVTVSCSGTQTWREDFGSTTGNLPTLLSTAEHPYDSTFCLNGYITNTTVGLSPSGGTNFTGDVSGDGDNGTHFLYHYTGVGGVYCSNAAGAAAWKNLSVINVVAGETYEFSYYYRKQNTTGSATVIQQQIIPASGTITKLDSTYNPIVNGSWVKNRMIFTPSASGPITLRLNNMLGPVGGNDFGIDNIALTVLPPAPIALNDTIFSSCPTGTYNLATITPTALPGYTYQWHTVATNPSSATLISNPTTASGNGPFYLYTYSPGGCYSTPDTVIAISQTCPPVFGCTGNTYLVQDLPAKLYRYDLLTGKSSVVKSPLAGTSATVGINGIGYNTTDGYLWGYQNNTGKIVRIGADGSTTYFTIPGLPTTAFNVGDVSANGVLFLTIQNGTSLYRVDVNPSSPTYLQLLPNLTTTGFNIADIAFNPIDGNLYSLSATRQLIRYNPATGAATNLGVVTGGTPSISSESTGFGGVFFDSLGNYYVSANTLGQIFKIANTAGGGLVATNVSSAPASGNNDGARCNGTPLCTVPQNPVASSANVYNTCPATTFDLTTIQPASVTGVTYEWHTTPVNPLASTLVANPQAVTASGKYYLFAKSNAGACYSNASDTIVLTIYNPCTDCDGDGIPNDVDSDDDNDGVADTVEQGCGTTKTWTSPASFIWQSNISPNLKVKISLGPTTGTNAWSAATNITNFARNCTDYTSNYAPITNVNNPAFQLTKASNAVVGTFTVEYLDANNNPVTINNPRMHVGGLGGSFGSGQIGSSDWKLQGGKTFTTLSADAIDFGSTADSFYHKRLYQAGSGVNDCATGEGSATLQINGPQSTYTFNVRMNGATIDQMVFLFEGCDILDTDQDGIVNACDLDSDGDGCSDAFESGATTNTAANYSFPLPVNANGVSTSVGTFTSTYGNALDSSIHTCPQVVADTLKKTPACLTCSVNACATADNLPVGTGTVSYTTCGTPNGYTAVGPDANGCITYTPNGANPTPDTTCIVACKNGTCDTTYIIINPPISPDTNKVTPACPTCPVNTCVVADDLTPGGQTYTSCGTPNGYTAVGPDANGCITYTPNGANLTPDTTCIVACKNGTCDTTYIIINPPVTPDTNKVTPACPTCSVNTCVVADDLTPGGQTYTSCGTPNGYTAVGPDANGCMTFTPNGVNLTPDTTCIVACKNGVCDTTYIIINPPVTPDTNKVTPACPTCPVNTCVVADDLTPGGQTYTSCGTPNGYTAVGPDANGCITYTPNGVILTPDTTCIVACKNGVCDTTYIIINPPVTPDTNKVTPACPTCPVNTCVVADDLTPGGQTYTSCGTPNGYTAVGPDANGCITYTPNGVNPTADTSCIVACKNGVCDTTYIIINPPVKPDTIVKIPATPTSSIQVCATKDDLPTSAGNITYTSCGVNLPALGTQVLNPSTGCVTFYPNGTQGPKDTVKTCVVACKNGICDTTYIVVPPVIAKDTITLIPACPTCILPICATQDDIDTSGGTTTYTTCGTPAGYTVSGPTINGCFTFTGNGTQDQLPDTTCIIACNNGHCDTTVIIVKPPVKPDSIIVYADCPTCYSNPICATADDLPLGIGNTTYTTCGITPSGKGTLSAINPTSGCMTFTGNNTFTTDTLKTCIVACKNGICDTTYITIVPATPPYGPDTIQTQVACKTCATNPICATGDDLPSSGTASYQTCGLDANEATEGTLSFDANNCLIWTPNGTQQTTITTCVIKCMSNGVTTICDTTYIHILPAPVADTVVKTPNCTTCPTTICPTADDLPLYGTITSQTCGLDANEALQGTIQIDNNGCAVFTPNGLQIDTIQTCIVKCVNGICDTTYIVIPPVPLEANPDINVTWVNTTINGNVKTNDNGYPSTVTYGNANAVPGNPGNELPVINANGDYSFTASQPGIYQFEVPVQACATCPVQIELLTITVLDSTINTNPPVANVDLAITSINSPVTIKTLINDKSSNVGVAGELNPASVTITSNPIHGVATVNTITGDITYTPNSGFTGKDTIYYQVCDKQLPPKCATSYQVITVVDTSGRNSNTTLATDDYNQAVAGVPIAGNAMTNDMDVEGDTQKITPQITSISGKGTLVLEANGQYVFTPEAGFVGTISFPYETTDARGAVANATIYILVSNSSPLPAILKDMQLVGGVCKTNINWRTLSELNVDRFDIQRNWESKGFETIGYVKSRGNSTDMQSYTYADMNVQEGRNEYRLSVVDIDGKVAYSNTQLVSIICAGTEISLYPNPATDIVQLVIKTDEQETFTVKVVDMKGNVVMTASYDVSHQSKIIPIDIAHMANGLYHMVITNSYESKMIRFEKTGN